ncbi:TetR/AcrR family transcriptional regulator [Streptacidiphilus sp. MAP5-3]|uniref:TetR/AcrR family transcriptional regulator n=1 Tax=unclassified Streptacidiphilus TaxID=2643834 RepID=UPI0035157636
MARVSPQYRDSRRRQILDGARRCFLAKGFRAASMQDVSGDVGLSTGAVYSYFSGKEALIADVAADAAGRLGRIIVAAAVAEPFPTVNELLDRILANPALAEDCDGSARLLIQVWSECLHNPALTDRLRSAWAELVEELLEYGQRLKNHATPLGGASAEHLVRAVIGIVQGLLVQRALLGPTSGDAIREGLSDLVVRM